MSRFEIMCVVLGSDSYTQVFEGDNVVDVMVDFFEANDEELRTELRETIPSELTESGDGWTMSDGYGTYFIRTVE